MFRVNMGVRDGEKILVVTDMPNSLEWREKSSLELNEILRRCLLAKKVGEIASQNFPACKSRFHVYISTGRSGVEPSLDVGEEMRNADVVVAMSTHSLSHTKAREEACKAGARVASMPGFLPEMLYAGGPMVVDHCRIVRESEKLAGLLTNSVKAEVSSRYGTEISFSLEGRRGLSDTGLLVQRGSWGNLPSGEAFIAPVEGTTNGRVVVKRGWHPDLGEDMILIFKDGNLSEVVGGGKVGRKLQDLMGFNTNAEPYLSRRNLAELGVGTNPNARRRNNILEAEKIRGTVHIAVGGNSHMGGLVEADLHIDFVLPKATLLLDDETIMKNGRLKFR